MNILNDNKTTVNNLNIISRSNSKSPDRFAYITKTFMVVKFPVTDFFSQNIQNSTKYFCGTFEIEIFFFDQKLMKCTISILKFVAKLCLRCKRKNLKKIQKDKIRKISK